jgi:hypothetical protein
LPPAASKPGAAVSKYPSSALKLSSATALSPPPPDPATKLPCPVAQAPSNRLPKSPTIANECRSTLRFMAFLSVCAKLNAIADGRVPPLSDHKKHSANGRFQGI